jgi:hypothetical protein
MINECGVLVGYTDKRKTNCLEKILVQGHFVYHKSQIDLFGIKPVPQS